MLYYILFDIYTIVAGSGRGAQLARYVRVKPNHKYITQSYYIVSNHVLYLLTFMPSSPAAQGEPNWYDMYATSSGREVDDSEFSRYYYYYYYFQYWYHIA